VSVIMSGDTSNPRVGRVWRSADGTVSGTVQFGDQSWPYLAFYSSAEARAHAAAAAKVAEAMERLEAESAALPAKGESGDASHR
jgi:hypothetical protein